MQQIATLGRSLFRENEGGMADSDWLRMREADFYRETGK
jgi:hypothetical protein